MQLWCTCQYICEREARAAAVAFAKEQLHLHAAEVPEDEVRDTGLSSQPVHDDGDAAAETPTKRVRGEANLVSLLTIDDNDDGADVNTDNQELSLEQQLETTTAAQYHHQLTRWITGFHQLSSPTTVGTG